MSEIINAIGSHPVTRSPSNEASGQAEGEAVAAANEDAELELLLRRFGNVATDLELWLEGPTIDHDGIDALVHMLTTCSIRLGVIAHQIDGRDGTPNILRRAQPDAASAS